MVLFLCLGISGTKESLWEYQGVTIRKTGNQRAEKYLHEYYVVGMGDGGRKDIETEGRLSRFQSVFIYTFSTLFSLFLSSLPPLTSPCLFLK